MKREGRDGIQRGGLALLVCGSLLAPFVLAVGAASADVEIGEPGEGAGQIVRPSDVSADPGEEVIYVADVDGRRVVEFTAAGEFIRTFGWGVVASGPNDDPHNAAFEIDVDATGGTFNLLFVQIATNLKGSTIKQETAPIPFDAPASGPGSVQAALQGTAAIDPGDVAVSGPPGGPFTVEFAGFYADARIHPLEEGAASALTGGGESISVTTIEEGGAYEICEAAAGDVCREGQFGTAPMQMRPQRIAVDPADGSVYVFEQGSTASHNEPENVRIQKFTAAGEFLYMIGGGVDQGPNNPGNLCTATSLEEGDVCGRGAPGSGQGQFEAGIRRSVDVGPGGVLHASSEGRVQRFEAIGAYIDEIALPEIDANLLAVDSAENIYTGDITKLEKYSAAGALLDETTTPRLIRDISIGPADKLFAAEGPFPRGIREYDSVFGLQSVFYTESGGTIVSSAVLPSADGYVLGTTLANNVEYVPLPPPGPVVYPAPAETFADPIGNVKATLNARVNPEGKATTFHFEYVDQAGFEEGGFESPKVESTPESGSIGSDFELHDAIAEITGLTPETVYHFRVVASNADGSDRAGPGASFESAPPLELGPTWSTAVGSDTAVLHAEINPFGLAATGHFEYVDQASFEASEFAGAVTIPAEPLDFGAGEEFVARSTQAYPLQPGTTYRYRLVASDHCKPEEPEVVCTFEGPVRSLTTFSPSLPSASSCPNGAFRSGAAAYLPDCRAYEMVSPVDKGGANIETVFNITGYPARLDQAAPDGQSITYSAYKAFGDPEGAPYSSQYVSSRTGSGWSTEPISPPREGPTFYPSAGLDYQFKAFTDDLCAGWPLQDTALSLAPASIAGFPNLYRRQECGAGAGGYSSLTTGAAPAVEPKDFYPELQGFSADGSVAVFRVKAKLTTDAKTGRYQLYEARDGDLNLVCILPNGFVPLADCSAGTAEEAASGMDRNGSLANAVSADGSRIFWTQSDSTSEGKIFVRIDGSETVAVSESVSTSPARFRGAAADGSRALFTIGQNLYEFDVDAKTPTLIAEGVVSVVGASEDATRVYLLSTKALAEGATAGAQNLYLAEGGNFTLIAALPEADVDTSEFSPVSRIPVKRLASISSDGNRIAFVSTGSLTGYDNLDAVTGEADGEVFLFDATAKAGAGELLCISCNPSGARPVGSRVELREGELPRPFAALIPTWETQLYAPRVISDDGTRAYFTSFEALVARDTNGKADVYQWERAGAGDCAVANPLYSPAAGGCVGLISSGKSTEDSAFVDLSADGADVFFTTYESLVEGDPDLVDVYDARVGGGFPGPAPEALECEGEACQSPAVVPQDPTPSSSSYQGPGNIKPKKKARRCPKGKHKVKRKGKVRCVKNKGKKGKRKHRRHRRHDRRAGR